MRIYSERVSISFISAEVYITSGNMPSTSTKLSTLIYAHNAPYRYEYNKLLGYHFCRRRYGTNEFIRGVWLTTILKIIHFSIE